MTHGFDDMIMNGMSSFSRMFDIDRLERIEEAIGRLSQQAVA